MSTTRRSRRKRRQRTRRASTHEPRGPIGITVAAEGPEDEPVILELVEFEVTEEPMPDPRVQRLPPAVRDRVEAITAAVVGEGRVAEQLDELESLVERYPDVPRLQNYLSLAYEAVGREDEARAWVHRTYEQFPDYVFGLTNYVRYCLHQGDVAEAGRALDGRFMITQFAPGRRRFHQSEVVNYQGVVGEYMVAIGEREAALTQLEMLQEMRPDHPQVRRLAAQLFPGSLRRLLGGLRGRGER